MARAAAAQNDLAEVLAELGDVAQGVGTSGKNDISGITSYVVCDPVWKTSLLKLITCIKNLKN